MPVYSLNIKSKIIIYDWICLCVELLSHLFQFFIYLRHPVRLMRNVSVQFSEWIFFLSNFSFFSFFSTSLTENEKRLNCHKTRSKIQTYRMPINWIHRRKISNLIWSNKNFCYVHTTISCVAYCLLKWNQSKHAWIQIKSKGGKNYFLSVE